MLFPFLQNIYSSRNKNHKVNTGTDKHLYFVISQNGLFLLRT